MERFPNGFAVGPGSPDDPGVLSRIILATSHLPAIASKYPYPEGNQGYMYVDMEEAEEGVEVYYCRRCDQPVRKTMACPRCGVWQVSKVQFT